MTTLIPPDCKSDSQLGLAYLSWEAAFATRPVAARRLPPHGPADLPSNLPVAENSTET